MPTAETSYAQYARTPAQGVDGLHASMENEVSLLLGTDVYQHSAGIFPDWFSGEAAIEAIKRRCRSCMASVYVPAADAIDAHFRLGNLIHIPAGRTAAPCVVIAMPRQFGQATLTSDSGHIHASCERRHGADVVEFVGLR